MISDVLCNNAADDNRHDWETISSEDWDYYHKSQESIFCIGILFKAK